ncbi:Ig-like and fibronectin type-III domain-containing protein 2 isoform X3 [Bradysia coprophila]|nr:Ig-like and fibronectin type-III domain-containing protein 2 isoform X3 [Bradysia coprophila]
MHLVFLNGFILATTFFQIATSDTVGTGGPSIVTEGKDALLTCVIMAPFSNDTVLWRKGPNGTILSAGMNRVTNDKRISVLHDETAPKGKITTGGDVWVLLIKNTRPSDTDVYICEVNSDPIAKSFHPLKVKSLNSTIQLESGMDSSTTDAPEESTMPSITHDFTDCCQALNVSTQCIGFCTIHNILDGTTGTEPEMCEKDFPNIVKCMADGRNHLPCCEKKKIPDLCQDMCQGEYTPFTDFIRSRVSCIAHTLPALQCILEGVQKIPSEPEAVYVEALNEKSLQVSWSPPSKLADKVKTYSINVTTLHTFDQDALSNITSEISVTVSKDLDSAVINDLKPFTMYVITVTANNDFGSSLPSMRVRALTLDSVVGQQTNVAVVPILPDVRGCCMKQGMTHRTCLDRMCDPKKADFTEIPDLMVCAPWANITFSCLANKVDHTPCCVERGIPSSCLDFCAGNITTITFSLFKCLQYMSDYSSCLLQGYGVLPGQPSRVKAPLVSSHFAILEWNPPKVLPDTVTAYHVSIRKLGSGDDYEVIEKDHPPLIMEGLDSATYYEAYVVAVNAHGKGDPSPRLVFRTKHDIDVEPSTPSYNITTCCLAASLLPQCMPLCSYDIKMSDLQSLGQVCSPQMGALAKCASGGRDHTSCCNRRGVPAKCISLCRGVLPQPPVDCLSYGGNIIQCFEEGTENIPGPVEDLHVTSKTDTSISLEWVPATPETNSSDLKNIDYLVQYGKVDNMTMYETIIKLPNEINTTETEIELKNLERNAIYRIMVVSRGEFGSSLPSSMLVINTSTSNANYSASDVYAVPSPPHSLLISDHSATWVRVAWQPPEFSHPHEIISYKVYHKSTSADKFTITETRLLWTRLSNLKPNTQHVIYVVAIGSKGLSLPSETLVAWTDPALPAFVDPPTIHPANIIAEGGSMTILCLALGNPAPTISLYVGGHLVRQDTSRHMVTTIHNVTTDMEHVSCYADNGYGIPMQASKKIQISFAPQIQASGITLALLGDRVDLKCTVKAKPAPKVIFWRDHEGRVPVIVGKNYEMTMEASSTDISTSTMTLSILKLTNEYVGDYFCHAENPLGAATSAVSVRIRPTPTAHNISECCITHNVSAACMDACSFYVDIDSVKDRPECISDFDKLMRCAADGSDHRQCCAAAEVPRHCLNWCRGEPVGIKGSCVLDHTKTIIDCFQTNRDRLPSSPLNLAVQVLSNDEALISWEPPIKNPHMVEGYRVYLHEADPVTDEIRMNHINGFGTHRIDTKDLNIRIGELKQNVVYELVVKAGNQYGSSVLTDPLKFTMGDHKITSASNSSGVAGTVCGILAGIIAIALAIVAIFFYQRRKFQKSANGVAFENPSYLREVNMEHVQISAVSADNSNGTEWRQERLQTPAVDQSSVVPMATEVNPSLYEELKLGHEGVGFKRLVS